MFEKSGSGEILLPGRKFSGILFDCPTKSPDTFFIFSGLTLLGVSPPGASDLLGISSIRNFPVQENFVRVKKFQKKV
jgi:hypothetical protein